MARKQVRTERELQELRRDLAARGRLADPEEAPASEPELERRAQERIA